MTMTDRPTPCLPVRPQAAPWWRWLRWPLAAGVLVLVGLLTPTLTNREEAASPALWVASRLTSTAPSRARLPTVAPWVSIKARTGQSGFGKPFQRKLDRPRALNPTGTPTPPTPVAPLLGGYPPGALLGATPPVAIPAASATAQRANTLLFLPLVVRAESQRISLPTQPPVATTTLVPAPPRIAPVVSAATATPTAGAESADYQLFLALVLRADDAGNVGLHLGTATPVPSATSEEANAGANQQTGSTLFLPFVAETSAQAQASPTSQPSPDQADPGAGNAATSTPTATPTAGAPTSEATEATATAPATATPTPATAHPNQAQQQLQALLDQVDHLIESGGLSAAQGQPLVAPITVVMQLPIVTQGQAPPNPTPGQPRPWQRKMQTFIDQVNQLITSGVLSAAQGQPLLDQAQAIIQTLGRA